MRLSLGDAEDVVVIRGVDGTVVGQVAKCGVKLTLFHLLVHDGVDVILVDELIRLAQLFHNAENRALRVDRADLDGLSAHVMSGEATAHVVAHHA